MKLIKPSFEIITPIHGEEILKQIELAARTCYKSEGKIEYTDGINDEGQSLNNSYAKSARPLITKLINLKHEAMLEFGGMITVKFICDRGVSHELVRHRLSSFAQESTRYCNYGKDEHIQFIIPNWSIFSDNTIINNKIDVRATDTPKSDFIWMLTMLRCSQNYVDLLQEGWSPQQARSVLPNSLKTEINVSANLREWRHIFQQRVSKAAHPQMRELMCPLLDEFKKQIPLIFDDITY